MQQFPTIKPNSIQFTEEEKARFAKLGPKPSFIRLQISKFIYWITGRHDILRQIKFIQYQCDIIKSRIAKEEAAKKKEEGKKNHFFLSF